MKNLESPEVANCPHCKKPMTVVSNEVTGVKPFPYQTTLNCKTEGCVWEGTGRTVSTDARGNVFEREIGPRGMDKDFPIMTADQLSRGRAIAEEAAGRNLEEDER